VRRRHHADIRIQRARGAEALESVLLQDAQEFRLQVEREVTDFVEEQRPPVSQFKAPEALRERPREGAFFIAEEFAFEQPAGNGGAVERDEGARVTRTEGVQRPCQEFFAGAGLALQEYGGIGRGHEVKLRQHRLERRALPEDLCTGALGAAECTEHGSFSQAVVS
jgi:hypothetical protein